MVRSDGKRGYDEKLGRTGALVELVAGDVTQDVKDSWKEVPFYDEDTGAPAYVDLAKVHQVQLAVLDLCALTEDGVAAIEIDADCPGRLIEPWKKRYERLQTFFAAALETEQVQAVVVEAVLGGSAQHAAEAHEPACGDAPPVADPGGGSRSSSWSARVQW